MPVRRNYKIFDFSFSLSSDTSQTIRLFDLVYKNFSQKDGLTPSFSFEVFSENGKRGVPHLKVKEKIYPFHGFSTQESQCFKLITDEIYRKIDSHVWIHGGGVAFQNKGIMVLGDSGTGKTSLILKLLSSGFKFLSDEVIPVEKKTGMMVPFFRSVGLRSEARDLFEKEFSLFQELEFTSLWGHKYFGNPSLLKSKKATQAVFPEYFFYLVNADSASRTELDVDLVIEEKGAGLLTSLEKVHGLRVLESTREGGHIYVMTKISKTASVIKKYLEACEEFKRHIIHTEKRRETGLKFSQVPRVRPLSFPDIGLLLLKQSKENVLEYNSPQERVESLGAYWLDFLKELNLEKMKGFEIQVGRMENTVESIQNLVR
ncbi:MAG: hypothetical protein GTO17_07780 [Candidatus Aminicenantes bacterium]|nr:hypothetical protein [Candidatus Aminicenantes bacterium]